MVDVGDRIPLAAEKDEFVILKNGVATLSGIRGPWPDAEWVVDGNDGDDSHFRLGSNAGLFWLVQTNIESPVTGVIFGCTKITVEWQYTHANHGDFSIHNINSPFAEVITDFYGEPATNIKDLTTSFARQTETFDIPEHPTSPEAWPWNYGVLHARAGTGSELLIWKIVLHK